MRRFFAEDSFWNTPIPRDARTDRMSDSYLSIMGMDDPCFRINRDTWTMPVYEADETTPLRRVEKYITEYVHRERFYEASAPYIKPGHPLGHGPGFGDEVPIPSGARPDLEDDSHVCVVDWRRMLGWDMWAAEQTADGRWRSCTGMVYALDGPGVFDPSEFSLQMGESIHMYGPSRASGIPAIAGLIMHEHALAGEIPHKLVFATERAGLQQFVPPCIWSDGWYPGGIPEGAIVQLDPDLDLSRFELGPGGLAVARCLQRYGAVCVDGANANALYAEGIWAKPGLSWEGVLERDAVAAISLDHYRVIEIPEIREGGLDPTFHHWIGKAYRQEVLNGAVERS